MRLSLLLMVSAIFLAGCSGKAKHASNTQIDKNKSAPSNIPQARSERDIQMEWRGKPVKELVKKYGNPDSIINTTLLGGPASEGYVYEEKRMAGNPGCVNVYVVTMSDEKILKYFCR